MLLALETPRIAGECPSARAGCTLAGRVVQAARPAVNPLPAPEMPLERASARSRTEPRFGLALGVPHCPANGLRTGRRDESLLRGSARNRGGPLELIHHQGDAPPCLPLAPCARHLPEQMARPANPSIQNDGQLLAPAERSRQGQRNRRAGVPAGGGAGERRIHEWALIHAAVIRLALCQSNARDLALGLADDPTENDRSHSRALEGAKGARNLEVAEEQQIGVGHSIDCAVLR